MAYDYTYGTATYNGVTLRYIKTPCNNIAPTYLKTPVAISNSGYYGINGGFFIDRIGSLDITSIAVVNGTPLGGRNGDGTGGWTNGKYGTKDLYRGTLVWDGVTEQFSVQEVYQINEIKVRDTGNYWAQGGISMCLGKSEAAFLAAAEAQRLPEYATKDTRAGIVYNHTYAWLVITANKCTASDFRAAIKNKLNDGSLLDGIFLDGGASTSMRCAEFYKDGCFLPEMIRVKDKK